LNCLYAISELLERPGVSLAEILRETVNLIPAAWQYPEITCARVTLDGEVFESDTFEESPWSLKTDIVANGEHKGTFEVYYREERPRCYRGPFLREELKLMKAIGEKLGKIIWLKSAEKSLKESEERYRTLAENVADGVIVSQNGRILFANRAFGAMFRIKRLEEIIEKSLDELSSMGLLRCAGEVLNVTESEVDREKSFRASCVIEGGKSLWVEGQHGVIQFKGRPAILSTLRDVTDRILRERALQEEADILRAENINLRSSMKERYRFGNILGKSQAMQEVYELILKAAHSDAIVSVSGESGTGKEVVARAIHDLSSRRGRDFVAVNCGAVPETLLESEFFGHKKGAFTGAYADKMGYLDIADGGTLFLDEIGELSVNMQVKLLRAVDGGEYSPVGSSRPKRSDFRIIAATNRSLADLLRQGMMREDFYYRINVIPIVMPPLRERREDIPLLVDHFLALYAHDEKQRKVPAKIMDALLNHPWPGNVRELQNVLRRRISVGRWDFLGSNHGAQQEADTENAPLTKAIENLERASLVRALKQTRWNRTKAAAILGISRRALFRKMKKLGL
jgi:PAS domain S-box-containing protein